MKGTEEKNRFHTFVKGEADLLCHQNLPFEIHPFSMGSKCVISDINEPHLHDYYVIQYITEGGGTHVIDFQSYDVKPNTLFFLSPHQLHFWQPTESINGLVLIFTEDFVISPLSDVSSIHDLAYFHSFSRTPRLAADVSQTIMLNEILKMMKQEFEAKSSGYETVLRAYLHAALVNIHRLYDENVSEDIQSPETALTRRFKHMVSASCVENRSIQSYADSLGVSVSTLNATIKDVTGKTPGQILRSELLLEAKRLLANTDMTASEIAYELQFEDPSYFGRFFRREEGGSPSSFRDKIRKQYNIFS